uniref:RrF2 family transcriptional regulator n=1 Tax=Eubacterium cellulosolvens TaxID=29322 RepID=UPI00048302F0|nr:Rrf2 family transcriptional regulator [[Eubacterium] cellulosolvens]
MKLTTRGRYGLRALIDLAENQDGGAVSTQSIAQRQDISESYLEQLIRMLKKSGLVTSVRGAGGGYRLSRPASEISVGDVLRSLEGSLEAVECPAIVGDDCSSADECVTKIVWKRINDGIAQAVDSIMISELVDESMRLKTVKKDRTVKERSEAAINARIIRNEQNKSVREAQD